MNTAELVEACRAGDPAAIEALVCAHQGRVYRLALSVLDDPAEADEAAQDALVAALRALDSYRGDAAFTTWLYAITMNVCRGHLRRRRARERLHQALQAVFRLRGGPDDPEDRTVRREADRGLWRAIQALGEKHRLPVILRYYHELSIAEIAQVLGISEGTVHSRLYTARERLKEALCDRGQAEPVGERNQEASRP